MQGTPSLPLCIALQVYWLIKLKLTLLLIGRGEAAQQAELDKGIVPQRPAQMLACIIRRMLIFREIKLSGLLATTFSRKSLCPAVAFRANWQFHQKSKNKVHFTVVKASFHKCGFSVMPSVASAFSMLLPCQELVADMHNLYFEGEHFDRLLSGWEVTELRVNYAPTNAWIGPDVLKPARLLLQG